VFFGFGALTGDGGVVRTGWAVGTGEMAHGVWYTVYGGVAERVMTRAVGVSELLPVYFRII
jgi:hypothetical protein